MKRALIFAVILFALATPALPRVDERAAAAAPANAFVNAWNHHDMNALADLYTSDADFVNVIGLWWHGRDEIRAEHVKLHEGRMKQTTVTSEPPVVRFLSPDVALVHAKWELRGDAGAPGWKIGDVRRGILTHVMVRRNGKWRIASTQNTDIVDIPNN